MPQFGAAGIGAFRSLSSGWATLKDRRMSWIVSKVRTVVFYYKLKLQHLSRQRFYDLLVSRNLLTKNGLFAETMTTFFLSYNLYDIADNVI